ncbi:protein STRUBBELIG-RECEPTOR FAMILY 6-like [Phalaenopsis equestris]|uniref:protein STRUBBELIG-RECEPTOR FAMILY 6-like n=1 Tax=Phalaenopsis equestris TaxID=78828 RepID=UPI0009E3477F|nr:protein STRUBBELIG-RECEPTOR FAMILY 6-like [Phalaenopsis equestris]
MEQFLAHQHSILSLLCSSEGMSNATAAALLLLLAAAISGYLQTAAAAGEIDQDAAALRALMDSVKNMPPGWGKSEDPCGSQPWEGVSCAGSRVTQLKLYNMGLRGTLSGDIGSLTELKILFSHGAGSDRESRPFGAKAFARRYAFLAKRGQQIEPCGLHSSDGLLPWLPFVTAEMWEKLEMLENRDGFAPSPLP